MESVINPDFIKSIGRNRSELNSAFEFYSSGKSRIESSDIFNIFTKVANPLFDTGANVGDKIIISIFKSMLKLISKRLIGESCRYKELEDSFYSITGSHTILLSRYGGEFLIVIYNALLNLNIKIPSINKWAETMSSLVSLTDIDTFKKTGFVLAWTCGAASARENAAEIIPLLNRTQIEHIFGIGTDRTDRISELSEHIINNPWIDPVSILQNKNDTAPVFKTAGGFIGYGSVFRRLPIVCAIDDIFYATDGVEVFRIYADYYGVELVLEHSLRPDEFPAGDSLENLDALKKLNINGSDYGLPSEWKTGFASIALNSNTAIWTLNDSYKLYIAGLQKNYA